MKKYTCVLVLILCATGSFAQNGFKLKVSGDVTTPLELSLQDLAGMPRATAVLNDKDGKPHQYNGVPVTAVLARAGVTVGKELRGEHLSKYLLVKCADGYEVLFSLAELDSSFTDRQVILADAEAGNPLPAARGPLRFVVPGEKKPARSCFQVVEFIVRYAKD